MSAEIDRLYALPLDEFIPQRDALAKSLRKGDREAAEAVKKLKKPTVAAWAINQVRRDSPDDMRKLLEVAEELHRVYAGLGAAGARERLGEASDIQRDLIRSLVRCARQLLEAGGHAATDATLEKVAETLRAAALDAGVREEVAAGRVVKEQRAAGLGPLETVPRPKRAATKARGKGKATATPKPKGPTAEERKRERKRKAAEERAAKARAALEEAERALRDLD